MNYNSEKTEKGKLKDGLLRAFTLLVIIFFLNLPFIEALEISNVGVDQISENSALLSWNTDEESDSFVSYGTNSSQLRIEGDASLVTEHEFILSELLSNTTYLFKVESGGIEANNSGNFYSFQTLPPDRIAPDLKVKASSIVAGDSVDVQGWTESGSNVQIYINGVNAGSTLAREMINGSIDESNLGGEKKEPSLNGQFEFVHLSLEANQQNILFISSSDVAGNKVNWSGEVYSDTSKPRLDLANISSVVDESSLKLHGDISENSTYEIFVNNRSAARGEGTLLEETITLSDGNNLIEIRVKDVAGWETSSSFRVLADTKAISVKAEVEKGYDYFERPLGVTSNINGQTKSGAKVYLYVYKVVGSNFHPDFKRDARAVVTADDLGNFVFKDVNFASLISDFSLKDIGPKEVPSNLLDIATYPIQEIAQQQYSTYQVYIIAESATGKSSYWQHPLTVHTCYSGLTFSVESINQFQGPLRLIPSLMDEGRQEIQAAFDFKYLGSGLPLMQNGEVVDPGYKINSISIEPACTAEMRNSDDKFGLGCKVLPIRSQQIYSGDRSKVYVTWKLNSAQDWSKRETSYWDEFKKSQIVFPLKVTLNYQEREGENKWSQSKTETACYDLGYYVDIPIESSDLVPDFLANQGVDALNWTIDKIDVVSGYVKDAYLIAGISCMGASTLKTAMRWIRIWTSKYEAYVDTVKAVAKVLVSDGKSDYKCEFDQTNMYLEKTLSAWAKNLPTDLAGSDLATAISKGKNSPEWKKYSLDQRCPSTASLWAAEASLDQVYRWTCDRAFCRAVPAKWTETKTTPEIEQRIIKQNECSSTTRGVYLENVENCQELIRTNDFASHNPLLYRNIVNETGGWNNKCWKRNGIVYVQRNQPGDAETINLNNIYHLMPVMPEYGNFQPDPTPLLAYQPLGSDNFMTGVDQSCEIICKSKGYLPITEKCRTETAPGQVNLNEFEIKAGYTRDCFVEEDGNFKQCICSLKDKTKTKKIVAREAMTGEQWFYQQDRVYKESSGTKGTYYPDLRYYAGRDLSGAFGANYLIDYVHSGEETEAKVDPHTQIIGTFQTLCLSGIYKNLQMLKSILGGLKSCIIEAKYTGLHDAGMCKALFSQHVCGLVYKALSIFNSGCSPNDLSGVNNSGVFGDVGAMISMGYTSMNQALETSVQDLRNDYGNARLNQYFNAGGQGVAQSICLAAFGYEIPIFSKDFLLDAAYAFPSKSSVLVAPAFREISTYNPAKQTAVINYELGGMVLPGCAISRWSISLKCIGAEDETKEGVDPTCMGQGCDCLGKSSLDAGRERLIKAGSSLESGQLFDVPLESPLVISDSAYRYDHVVIKLYLDQSERGNEQKCFDSRNLEGNVGVYYFPIKDVSPQSQLTCTVDAITGKYICPEISQLFGWGEAYLEEPYVDCWEETSKSWVSCDVVRYSVGDKIAVRAHINNDGKGQCLRRTVQGIPGIQTVVSRTLPTEAGSKIFSDDLGIVNEAMLGGSGTNVLLQLVSSGSAMGCSAPQYTPSINVFGTTKRYIFGFVPQPDGKVTLTLPAEASPLNTIYTKDSSGLLVKNIGGAEQRNFDLTEINSLSFSMDGFVVSQVLGRASLTDANKQCIYESGSRTSTMGGSGRISVNYEILDKTGVADCQFATRPVKSTAGKSSHLQWISVTGSETSAIHNLYTSGAYDAVLTKTTDVFLQKKADLENVLAVYYSAAARIRMGALAGDENRYSLEIQNDLRIFFQRKMGSSILGNEVSLDNYTNEEQIKPEFVKVKKYLCEIDLKYGGANQGSAYCST